MHNVHVLLTYTNFPNHIQMYIFKVTKPTSTTYLNDTRIFELCVSRCGTKNRQSKNMCSYKVEYVALNCQTIQDSTVNVIGRAYMIVKKTICHFIIGCDNHMSSQFFWRNGPCTNFLNFKVDNPYLVLFLLGYLYLNDMLFGEAPRINIIKTCG